MFAECAASAAVCLLWRALSQQVLVTMAVTVVMMTAYHIDAATVEAAMLVCRRPWLQNCGLLRPHTNRPSNFEFSLCDAGPNL